MPSSEDFNRWTEIPKFADSSPLQNIILATSWLLSSYATFECLIAVLPLPMFVIDLVHLSELWWKIFRLVSSAGEQPYSDLWSWATISWTQRHRSHAMPAHGESYLKPGRKFPTKNNLLPSITPAFQFVSTLLQPTDRPSIVRCDMLTGFCGTNSVVWTLITAIIGTSRVILSVQRDVKDQHLGVLPLR